MYYTYTLPIHYINTQTYLPFESLTISYSPPKSPEVLRYSVVCRYYTPRTRHVTHVGERHVMHAPQYELACAE